MYHNILVPTDGSAASEGAVDHAVELAKQYDATLHVLYVVDTGAYSSMEVGTDIVIEALQGEPATVDMVGWVFYNAHLVLTVFSDVPVLGSVPAVFRAEALWTGGVRFADFDKRAAALGGTDTDGTATRDTLRAAIAAEFALPGNTTMIFQPSFYYTFDWKDTLGPGFGGGIGDRWTLIPLLFLSRPFTSTQDRLRAELTVFPTLSGPDRDGQGIKTKLRLIYQLSQYITTQFVINGYDGGNDTDLYGQYDHWDNVGVELSYEF
jgi:hypothetical protein